MTKKITMLFGVLIISILLCFSSFAETISDQPIIQATEVTSGSGNEQESEAKDDFVYYSIIPLTEDVQRYLWKLCKENGVDYALALAVIQRESSFKAKAYHTNSNGSVDRGIMQTNSCWIKEYKRLGLINSADDLYDIYTGIKCGMHEFSRCVAKFGNCEAAYYMYNTGREKCGSNKNSRVVMQYWAEWQSKLK